MKHEIVGVVFQTRAQWNARGRFTVPAEVCAVMNIDKGSRVHIEVESSTGHHGPVERTLVSDREASPVGEMKDWMVPGEEITVIVRRA